MANFKLEILTPDRQFFEGEVESLIIKAYTGEMGIMVHTLPIVTILKSGILKIKQDGKWMEAVNGYGFVSVGKDKTTVMANTCAWPYEIDVNQTDEQIDTLSLKMKKAQSISEYKMAKAQLAVQLAKLKIKRDKY